MQPASKSQLNFLLVATILSPKVETKTKRLDKYEGGSVRCSVIMLFVCHFALIIYSGQYNFEFSVFSCFHLIFTTILIIQCLISGIL